MATRGLRWLRLALYVLGGLALAGVAMVLAFGKARLGARKEDGRREEPSNEAVAPAAAPPAAATPPSPPSAPPSDENKPADPRGRGRRLKASVHQPAQPPDWGLWDMNLE